MTPALARRIKQAVHAPVHSWFASCAPGLEAVLARELTALEALEALPVAGGVEFKGKLEVAYRANLWLRTANRVLMRIADFRARAPEELFAHARELRWETLLPSLPLRIEVSLHASRMTSDSLIARILRDAIQARLADQGLPPLPEGEGPSQLMLIRLDNNRLLLSLDTSGELLHKRGYREATAKAPMRETLAAGILLAAGYDGSESLLDPMCGAGTFPVEAALIARRLPPGLHRRFRFEDWPSFKEATWRHLKSRALSEALAHAPQLILAQDLHAGAVAATRANAARAGVSDDLTVGIADFFRSETPDVRAGLLVINPPYGRRVAASPTETPRGAGRASGQPTAAERAEVGRLYDRIGATLRRAYPGWRYAIVVPEPSLYGALRLPETERLLLPHGGLKVGVAIGRLPD